MSEIRKWLESIGLGQYADTFDANEIGMDLLGQVDDQMLKDIGVSIGGHRLRIRNAIAKLTAAPTAEVSLSSSAPPHETTAPSAERRQLTVMFCDLVGSTALSARLDPEDMREIIGAYHRCCAEQISKSGGFVAKYMGDGVLAYFGYPQAHEDDPERAVRAGLGLIEAAPMLRAGRDATLQVRVGIATGLVVVGDLIGEGVAQEQGVVGDTPNLAARLQAVAEPGQVVLSNSTRRLTGGMFEYRDLGKVTLKGLADVVQAWQVLGASTVESRFEAQHQGGLTPLVGREEEMELLLRRWRQAKGGDGSVVLISGEPGIGKSRIAQTLLEQLSGEPYTRVRYFCSPHDQTTALYPTITQLERAAGFGRDDTDEQRLVKLEAVLAQSTNDLSEAAPLLAALLSIPTGDRYPPLDLSPPKRKEKTLKALVEQVEGLAARQPVLIVVEDVHWIDPTTRELLDLTVDRVRTLPALLIITFRPEFTPPWVGRDHVTLLSLNRLPRRQRTEMIARVTGGKPLPKEIAEQIVDRTDGVPLFIEELTKTVIESGVVADAGDRYTVTGPVPTLAIPTTLHASLLARLDRLAPVRDVAQIGAVLGRQFSHELISAVALMPQQQLDNALAQLVSSELIFRHGSPPDAEYTFKHALVQDAAYSTLLRSRRQQLHARIAATLESKFPEIVAAQPQLMAQHCAEAGLNEKAIEYWLKAGQQAVARSAMTEAVAQLQKGLKLLAGLPDSSARWQQELDVQIALAPALVGIRGYSAREVRDTLLRAGALAEQLDRPEYRLPILYSQYAYYTVRAEHTLGLSLAEQRENLSRAQNNVVMELDARRCRANTLLYLGEFPGAREMLEKCRGLDHPAHRAVYAAMIAEDPHVLMLSNLAVTLAYLGYSDQARSRRDEALAEARCLKHAYTQSLALLNACWMEYAIHAYDDVLRHAEEAIALSSEHGFPLSLGLGQVCYGWVLTALRRVTEGIPLIRQGLAVVRATGAVFITPFLLTMLADAHVMVGQQIEGLDALAEAAQIIEASNERYGEAELHRVRGDLLNVTRDGVAAEQSYRLALDVAKRQSAKLGELRASTSLARLWLDQRKRTEARDLLAPIYGWFTEGFDTPVLQDAKALLDELA